MKPANNHQIVSFSVASRTEKDAIRAAAKKLGMTVSQLIREALADYLTKRRRHG